MFQFPGFAPSLMVSGFIPTGCPIRKSALHWIFAPVRGLSQLVTSFFASESQGILHVPFSPFLFPFGKSPLIIFFVASPFCKTYSAAAAYAARVRLSIWLTLLSVFARDYLCHHQSVTVFPLSRSSRLACDDLQFPLCQCSLFFVWRITDSNR